MSRTSVGTITYMSPERILGKPYNAKSDVWSFGIVMYELGNHDTIQPPADTHTNPLPPTFNWLR